MATKPSHVLGMNARYMFTNQNPGSAKKFGFSKLKAKELFKEYKLPTAEVYHIFENLDQIDAVQWETIPVPFVIKPASGSAGKGVWVITQFNPHTGVWTDSDGETVTKDELDLHVHNILDGEFSTWGSDHKALVEERVTPHPRLAKYAYRGTPDIRIIVFNSVPVMAMMRVPTKESHGRANLDQGAIGLGIDIATGVTTFGLQGKSQKITHFPQSKKKVNGILIPFWKKALETAVEAANAAGFRFMGADLFIHETKGPMIVELNGFPGLSIQLANHAGLKRRIERVEGLEVRDPEHGVKIAQALFAENFADTIKAEEGIQVISTHPNIFVYDEKRKIHQTDALVNTGRFRSVISESLAEELGLVDLEDLLWRQEEIEGKLPVVEVSFKLKNRVVTTGMLVSKRLDRTTVRVEIGRRDLQGFMIGDIEL